MQWIKKIRNRGEESLAILNSEKLEHLAQFGLLNRVDLTEHNVTNPQVSFSNLVSKSPSAEQCASVEFQYWANLITRGKNFSEKTRWFETFPEPANRKLWEWALILETAKISGNLQAGKKALGFAVGQEPIPAILADYGVSVLASDKHTDKSGAWIKTKEHMADLTDLFHPEIIDNDALSEFVRCMHIDMNYIPDGLGKFDFIWSSCAIEHLGSPSKGLDFVLESIEMLNPGGVAIHTTELELTSKSETADYGNCAVYRVQDFKILQNKIHELGYSMELNTFVDMSTPKDRWISRIPLVGVENTKDLAHLKLGLGDSISTSFSIVIEKK
jgi:hypothetical protein